MKITTLSQFHQAVLDAVSEGYVKDETTVYSNCEIATYGHSGAGTKTIYQVSILKHVIFNSFKPCYIFTDKSPEAVLIQIETHYKLKAVEAQEDLEIAELNQQAKDDAYREHQESTI